MHADDSLEERKGTCMKFLARLILTTSRSREEQVSGMFISALPAIEILTCMMRQAGSVPIGLSPLIPLLILLSFHRHQTTTVVLLRLGKVHRRCFRPCQVMGGAWAVMPASIRVVFRLPFCFPLRVNIDMVQMLILTWIEWTRNIG